MFNVVIYHDWHLTHKTQSISLVQFQHTIWPEKKKENKIYKNKILCLVYPVTVSSNISPAYAVSTQSIINNIQNTTTATNTSPSMKSFMLITSAATITTTTTNFSNSSCNPQYFRLMQNSSNHRRHSVSGTVNISLAQQQQIEKRKLKRQTKTKTTTTKKNDIE